MSYLTNPFRFTVPMGDPQVTNVYNTGNYTWTMAGTGSSYVAVTNGDDPSGSLDIAYSNGAFSGWGRGMTDILAGNTKLFQFNFAYHRGGGDNANNTAFFLTSYNWADDSPTGSDKIIKMQNSNGNLAFFRAETASESKTTNQDSAFIQATDTTFYYSITGDGSTWKGQRWSDADRTADEISTSDMDFPSDWTDGNDLDKLGGGVWSGYWGNTFSTSITSVRWDNGV